MRGEIERSAKGTVDAGHYRAKTAHGALIPDREGSLRMIDGKRAYVGWNPTTGLLLNEEPVILPSTPESRRDHERIRLSDGDRVRLTTTIQGVDLYLGSWTIRRGRPYGFTIEQVTLQTDYGPARV